MGTTDDVTPIDEGSFAVGDLIPLEEGGSFETDSGGIGATFPLANELRWFDLRGQSDMHPTWGLHGDTGGLHGSGLPLVVGDESAHRPATGDEHLGGGEMDRVE